MVYIPPIYGDLGDGLSLIGAPLFDSSVFFVAKCPSKSMCNRLVVSCPAIYVEKIMAAFITV